MNKQPEITAATRQRFVDVFCTLYATQPISRITVKELTTRAGYNRSTFYQYFKDVYDIQQYIEDQMMNDIRRDILSHLIIDLRNRNISDNYIARASHFLRTNETRIRLLIANPYNHHFALRIREEALHVVFNVLQIPSENVTVRYTFEFYMGGILALISKWLNEQDALSFEELAALVKSILERGILAQLPDNTAYG